MTTNVSARCSKQYFPAKNDSGPRPASYIRSVVIHCTEGTSDEGAAGYFHAGGTTAHPAGSTQLVVDDDSCFRCLRDRTIPWGAPPLNSHGLHVEQAGFSAWSRDEWLQHRETIRRTAWHVAKWTRAYRIPRVFLEADDLARLGESARGITTHNNVSLAFRQSSHTDPGPHYPFDLFMRLVKGFYRQMGAR